VKQELYDLAEWVVKTTRAAGAGDCRVSLQSGRTVTIGYRERKPENIQESSTKALLVEVFANNRYSLQRTSDVRRDALKVFLQNAVAMTKLLAEDPLRTLPDPKYYQGRAAADIGLLDPGYKALTPEDRHGYVRTLEDACLAKAGSKVISAQASVNDNYSESVLMTCNGFDGYTERTVFSAHAEVTVKDEGDRRPSEYAFAQAAKRNSLPEPEDLGSEAARRALDMLGGKKIKTETLPIIIENRVVPRFGDGFMQAMFGRAIQQKQSFLADKKGQKIASPIMTVIDDPFIPGGLGSRLFDGDGITAKKRVMIDAGVLKDFYIDWYYSRKLGWAPTSGSPSNVVMPPGQRSVNEIIKDLGRGIFVAGFIGGNSNSTTGDTSIGITGRLFDKGELSHAVSEMNIADNHLKIWSRLAEAANDPANDPFLYSAQRVPSLVFTDVVVAGI